MDNLPKDPPPPFGSGFTPHTNPVDPNNPLDEVASSAYPTQPQPNLVPPPPQTPPPNVPENPDALKHEHYSEVAQNKPRDEHGHFVHSNPATQTTAQLGQTPPTAPTSLTAPNPSFLPPIIEINQNTKPTEKEDPPLFGFFLTNPVTYLKKFLQKLLKRQMITLKIPVLALIIIMVGVGGYGIGFQSGLNYALGKLFPNFSPILHRSITAQGTIQKSSTGYFLQANDKNKALWTLKSISQNVNLADFEGMKVQIKGNLTPTPNLIDVSEIISLETAKPSPTPTSQTSQNTPNSPNLSDSSNLPKLYSNLTWEVTQSKVLLFTSGKRRIEQQGVYLESSQVDTYPQDFIDYYTNQLTNANFKQTFNSSEPNGTTITFAKDELFLTFGVKNIYSGSGDNKRSLQPDGLKKLVGYKAFIEHN